MKKYIKVFFVLLFIFFSFNVYSQSYKELYDLAKILQDNNQFEQASTEYKRYIFMQDYLQDSDSNKNIYLKDSYVNLAECYLQLEQEDLALMYIQNAINLCDYNSSTEQDIYLKHIELLQKNATKKNELLHNDYRFMTYIYLQNINQNVLDYAILSHLENLLVCKPRELSPWFSQWFNFYIELSPNLLTEEEKQLFVLQIQKITEHKPKSILLAAHLSFIPGLGQVYAQDYKDGLNAFLLNSSLIALSTYSLLNLYFIDFALLEFPFLYRFYRGNIYKAQIDTYNNNDSKLKELTKPLLEVVLLKKQVLSEQVR